MEGVSSADVRRRAWRVLVPVAAATAGLMLATSAHTSHGTDLRGERQRTTDLIAKTQSEVDALSAESIRLRQEVEQATQAQAAGDARVMAARRALDALAGPSGLTVMTGQGLVVALSDAPKQHPGMHRPPGVPDPTPDDLVVHQQDVQAVVNALWAGGAEAMTIMGQRVISTSAVRCVGNTLLLQGRVYSPPFVVAAVGEPSRLRAALDESSGVRLFRQYVADYGLVYRVKTVSSLLMPAYTGPLELAHATPVGS